MNFLKINLKPILFFSCYACVLIFSTIGDFNLFDWDEINFAWFWVFKFLFISKRMSFNPSKAFSYEKLFF